MSFIQIKLSEVTSLIGIRGEKKLVEAVAAVWMRMDASGYEEAAEEFGTDFELKMPLTKKNKDSRPVNFPNEPVFTNVLNVILDCAEGDDISETVKDLCGHRELNLDPPTRAGVNAALQNLPHPQKREEFVLRCSLLVKYPRIRNVERATKRTQRKTQIPIPQLYFSLRRGPFAICGKVEKKRDLVFLKSNDGPCITEATYAEATALMVMTRTSVCEIRDAKEEAFGCVCLDPKHWQRMEDALKLFCEAFFHLIREKWAQQLFFSW